MPISDCDVRDPRIRRTRQLLQSALRSLLPDKNLDEISVQDITDSATVNRATFYDHYTDKFALFEALVAGEFHALLHERNIKFDGTCPSTASAVILAVCDYLARTHSNSAACSRHRLLESHMDAAVINSIRLVLLEGVRTHRGNSALPPEMIASAVSWAIYGAAKEWFYTPDHLPADEIAPPILQLILPILGAVC